MTAALFATGIADGQTLERLSLLSALLWPAIVVLFLSAALYGLFATRPMQLQVMIRLGRPESAWSGSIRAALVAAAALTVCAVLLRMMQQEAARTQLVAVAVATGVTILAALALIGRLKKSAAAATAEVREWQDRTAAALQEIRSQFSSEAVMEASMAWLCGTLQVDRAALFLLDDGVYRLVKPAGWQGPPEVLFLAGSALPRKFSGVTGSGVLLLPDLDSEPTVLLARPPEIEAERQNLLALSARVIAPVRAEGNLTGLITLGPRENGQPYTLGALRFAEAVGAQVALSLDTAQRVEEYSKLRAATLQRSQEASAIAALRKPIAVDNAGAVSGVNWAASSSGSNGNPGEFFELCSPAGGGGLVLLGAKVPDGGFDGAVGAAHLRDWLRGRVSAGCMEWRSTAEILARSVGRRQDDEKRAIRLFCGHYDADSRRLRYLNAGFVAPFVLRLLPEGAQVMRLASGGAPLGGPVGEGWNEDVIELRPGDLLVGCTESLVRTTNPEGVAWGDARLLETVQAWESQRIAEAAQLILKTASEFATPSTREDSRMVVLLRVTAV